MIWEMEITEKQKRKEEKRIRRQERRKRKGKPEVDYDQITPTGSEANSDEVSGCGAPLLLLSRGIQFDRSERVNPFPPGTRLILRCNQGAKPFPKERAKCKCKNNNCNWSKIKKVRCIQM